MIKGAIDRGEVHFNDLAALFAVGFFDGRLDMADGFVLGHDVRNGEEAGLHDCVDALAHARIAGHLVGVNHIDR